jgi:hypothetical protein
MEPQQKESKKSNLLFLVIAVLVILMSFIGYSYYSSNKLNTELRAEKARLDETFKNLSDTLDVRRMEVIQITNRNTSLDSIVSANTTIIQTQKNNIAALLSKDKLSKNELAKAKTMIADYGSYVSQLERQMMEMNIENQKLIKENQQLGEDLNTERKTIGELSEENKGLSKMAKVGSLLQLSKIDVHGVKTKPNGKEREVTNAKSAESIRISFETGDNKVLPAGPVALYIRVINPKGETIAIAEQGSDYLTLAETNTKMQYSKKAEITWAQVSKKIIVNWSYNISSPGVYKVEIYQSGYRIGKGEVQLN